jgi:hypothetical protein
MSEQIDQLAAALIKAQKEIKHPTFNAEGQAGQRRYPYADLKAILDVVRPAWNEQGIAIVQGPCGSTLTTMAVHESGQWMAADYELPTECTPQQMGSAITYGKRYSLAAMAGVHAEQDDDAAEAERGEVKTEKRETPVDGFPMNREEALQFVTRQIIDTEDNKPIIREWVPGKRKPGVMTAVGDLVKLIASGDEFKFIDEVGDQEARDLYRATLRKINESVNGRLADGEAA